MQTFAHKYEIVDKILEYRGVKKLLSTYVEALPLLVNPVTGKYPHVVQPGRDSDRTALLDQSQPAKYSRAGRVGTPDPEGVHPFGR